MNSPPLDAVPVREPARLDARGARPTRLSPRSNSNQPEPAKAGALRFARNQASSIFTIGLVALTAITPAFWLLGFLNRLFGRPLRSVFVCYPGRADYARRYVADWAAPIARWRLFPIAVMRQQGGWGLVFATSANERDILHADARPRLERLAERIARIARGLGCSTVSMSGILPGACLRAGIGVLREEAERSVRTTARLALRAAETTATANSLASNAPLVVLGGRGAVGAHVVEAAGRLGRRVVVWDVRDQKEHERLHPDTPVVLLDVSRPGALDSIAERLPRGSVILSDVYPEPSPATVRRLEQIGLRVHHLAGVRATMMPSLPGAYGEVVPCCAAIDPVRSVPVVRVLGGSVR